MATCELWKEKGPSLVVLLYLSYPLASMYNGKDLRKIQVISETTHQLHQLCMMKFPQVVFSIDTVRYVAGNKLTFRNDIGLSPDTRSCDLHLPVLIWHSSLPVPT